MKTETRAPQHQDPALERSVEQARAALLALQEPDGHWRFPLEADCSITAEYVLMMHFMDEVDADLQSRIAVHLRAEQAEHGGWALYHGGDFDISCSVKAYWALKLAGDAPEEPHMARARAAILAHGGAARCNVFTRIAMAMFGQVPWRAAPFVPVEIVLLPRWFPFHISKVSYWSRTVMVPLSILCSLKARAKNPTGIRIAELFTAPPDEERNYFPARSRLNRFFIAIERCGRLLEGLIPGFIRRRALARAEAWCAARLNGSDGLGGIFPAMVNSYEALAWLGRAADDPERIQAREALRRLIVVEGDRAWCQPCFSPVWDTALACLALQEAEAHAPQEETRAALRRGCAWLRATQILDGPADWREYRPELAPGGWPFQYANGHYPDLDDTSAAAWALFQEFSQENAEALRRAADWLTGMQSRNGGFASFDADNCYYYLNEIPFADHGALLDPPTADVTARCIGFLGLAGREEDRRATTEGLDFLLQEQEEDGSWYGRWGTNYVYGTWSALAALEFVEDPRKAEAVRRAAGWLKRVQRPDGSWGESNDSYHQPETAGSSRTGTPFHTAWAVLGLIAAGEGGAPEVRRGVAALMEAQRADGLWRSREYNAPGFPRVFYLRYHGYQNYFPLWALARYRRFQRETQP